MTTRAQMLNVRQRRFVQEYLRCANGKEAANRAGYSKHSATEAAVRLKHIPKVARAIRLARAAEGRRAQIGADRVLAELARVAFSDIGRVADWGPGGLVLLPAAATPAPDRAAIAEIATRKSRKQSAARIRLHNKQRALETLARHLGLFDRVVPAPVDPNLRAELARSAREKLRRKIEELAKTQAAEPERIAAKD